MSKLANKKGQPALADQPYQDVRRYFTKDQDFGDNSASSNRARLLGALRDGPVNTHQARSSLDIFAPAPRIKELREQGHNIVTVWIYQETAPGRKHRIGQYVLLPAQSGDVHE